MYNFAKPNVDDVSGAFALITTSLHGDPEAFGRLLPAVDPVKTLAVLSGFAAGAVRELAFAHGLDPVEMWADWSLRVAGD